MSYDFGRLLRVDLTRGELTPERVGRSALESYLGGRGLGAWLLYHELAAGVDPLGPDNKVIFATGPLVGTGAPASNRYVVLTKSPQTGLYLMTICGGSFGGRLRKSGFDLVILEGQSEAPVCLVIGGGESRLRPAEDLWGLTTEECERWIRREWGREAGVACIGPAAENGVLYAGVFSDGRAAGRGGAGTALGAKKVKAIVALGEAPANGRGERFLPVSDPEGFREALRQVYAEIRRDRFTSETFPRLGSASGVSLNNAFGILPCRNWQEAGVPEAEKISGEALRARHWVADRACATPCPVRCSKIMEARAGPYAGTRTDGPEYETLYALGACCGIYDPDAVIVADYLCDSYGLDTISAGVTIAFAMECFERVILTLGDTDGLELRFGNAAVIPELLRKIAWREGCGELLALGSKRLAEKLGRGTEAFAMQAKGLELGAYDPRGLAAMALVYACGPRGGCHHAGGWPVWAEIFGKKELFAREGKAEVVKRTRDRRIGFSDSAMMCNFASGGVSDGTLARLISCVVGRDLDPAWFYALGDRVSTVERAFNARDGLRPEDDTLPRRILAESVPSGPSAGRALHFLNYLKEDFYRLCGWDLHTGAPSREKMEEAGLIPRDYG